MKSINDLTEKYSNSELLEKLPHRLTDNNTIYHLKIEQTFMTNVVDNNLDFKLVYIISYINNSNEKIVNVWDENFKNALAITLVFLQKKGFIENEVQSLG